MQSECPSGRRQQNRKQKGQMIEESDTSSSPVDGEQQNETNASSGNNGIECRRSSRKKTIKFDVRDLLNKNRKSHKIQIEARIDSNAPKLGAGQPSKEEINSKQKTFNEKSEIFRRYSISENRVPPRLPPPAALIQKIQQCVGELEQLPLDGELDLSTISPITRRLSRTQEILTASMMKPRQVNSLIVTKLESTTTTKPSPAGRGKVGQAKLPSKPPDADTSTTGKALKRRGRPPKTKLSESSAEVTESLSDNIEAVDARKPDEEPSTSNQHGFGENCANGRELSLSPDSSTKGIDLKEKLDASAVTLPQPTILDDCMLVSNDDLFVAAEEEVFTQVTSSDESPMHCSQSPKEKGSDEISLFARSDSTETSNSDDSERRRKKVRVSVKRVQLPSKIRERLESTSKSSSSDEKFDIIEISSNDCESIRDGGANPDKIKVEEQMHDSTSTEDDHNEDKVHVKRVSPRKSPGSSSYTGSIVSNANVPLVDDNSNSNTLGSIVEISSESTTTVEELLEHKPNAISLRTKSRTAAKVGGPKRNATEKLKNDEVSSKSSPEEAQLSTPNELPSPDSVQVMNQTTQETSQNDSSESTALKSLRSRRQVRETRLAEVTHELSQQQTNETTVPMTRSQMPTELSPSVGSSENSGQTRKLPTTEEPSFAGNNPVLVKADAIEEKHEQPDGLSEASVTTIAEQTQSATPRTEQNRDEDCKQEDSIIRTTPIRKALRSAKASNSGETQSKTRNTRESFRKTNKSVSSSDTDTTNSSRQEPTSTTALRSKVNVSSSSPPIPPSDSPVQDRQKTKPKGRQKRIKPNIDVSQEEETSSVHSESSLTSSSACSVTSTSPTSPSSPASSTSNSHVRASRSRALQLQSSPAPKKLPDPSTETITTARKSVKLEEEQFTEPESESSENSTRKHRQQLKDENGASSWLKERTKLIQRRKSARLSRWTTFSEEASETSSESSETYQSAKNRPENAKGSDDVNSFNNMDDETIAPVAPKTEEPKQTLDKGQKEPGKDDLPHENNVPADEKEAESPQKPTIGQYQLKEKDSKESDSTNKTKRTTRQFAQLKDNSSDTTENTDTTDTTALSDAEMPSSSTRTLRHTRARRKTISSATEFIDLIPTNLSPPDKAIEYKAKNKLDKSADETKKIQCKRLSVSDDQSGDKISDSIDSPVRVPEHAKEEDVGTRVGSKESTKTEEKYAKLEIAAQPQPDKPEEPIGNEEEREKAVISVKETKGESKVKESSVVDDTKEETEKSTDGEMPENTSTTVEDTGKTIEKPEGLDIRDGEAIENAVTTASDSIEEAKKPYAAEIKDASILDRITTVANTSEGEIEPLKATDPIEEQKAPTAKEENEIQEKTTESSTISLVTCEADLDKSSQPSSNEPENDSLKSSSQEELQPSTHKPDEKGSTTINEANSAESELTNHTSGDVPKDIAVTSTGQSVETKIEETIPPPAAKLDAKIQDNNREFDTSSSSFTKPEEASHKDAISTPQSETTENTDVVAPEKPQLKKDASPSKKKKHLTKSIDTPKGNTDESHKNTSQKKPKASSDDHKEHTTKQPSSQHQTEDSLKMETPKSEQKPIPHRQLDSSFIKSLEKSLLSTKKSSKKKERDSSVKSIAKEKEDPRKSNKSHEEPKEEKKAETSSPKPKKKHKESSKSNKKTDDSATKSKRKSIKKAKDTELNQSMDTTPPAEVSIDKTPSTRMETTMIPIVAPPESPVAPQKLVKSKGETKFYPDDSSPIEKIPIACESTSPPKEKSPESIPNPLKDIEKFIEDGENLLKRGYKLEDDEVAIEAGLDHEMTKADDVITPKKCKLDEGTEEKKHTSPDDDNSNSNSESSMLASTPTSETDTPNGIRRSHRIKNNFKSSKCLVGRGLVRDKERFSTKDDEKTIYSIDDQKMDLAEVEAKNSKFLKDMEESLSNFRLIRENEYKCERVISKEAKRMLCDCFLTSEEEERGELGCGEDCLNRLLMIECGSDCTVRDRCTNRRFVKFLYSPCRVFRTEKKGFGIMADIEILTGEFIMEYVGEVINGDEFERRRNAYSEEKNKHYYFMALRSDAIIDATAKGNISRFINHSCDPNAETQKWTVNGELRIGFFSKKNIMPGEEITFDYQYQRYGKEAQKCFCESANCRGWIGAEPSSEEEEEDELDEDDEGESEDLEEEEERLLVSPAVPAPIPAPTPTDEESATVPPTVIADITAIADKDALTQPVAVPTPIAAEAAVKAIKALPPKKKKEKKRLIQGKEEKIKRRENKQYLEDPDIEDEVRFLSKCGLRNQADTLRLSRLMVRAKLLQTRLKLLQILRNGELPCRRLFLDYHGVRLLHGWMSEVIDSQETEKGMEIRMALLNVLECLPISNKTMLTDSKVYQTVRDWSNNKETRSPNDESPKESTAPNVADTEKASASVSSELQKLAAKLVNTWDNLPEIFRIPKRERIEQMKEHEREADRQYKALGEDLKSAEDRNRERFMKNTGPKGSRFKWSRSEKERMDRDRAGDRRRYAQSSGSSKESGEKSSGDSHLSKEQRRELFAAKVARAEAEKRLAEVRREFEVKCRFFGLDPKRMRPENMPFCVNPSTGQWYSTNKKPITTPPSYAHVQVPVKPKSTDPNDYRLPPMDLPPFWKFAISPKGKIYYYHVKIRIPQWEPPIKILPLAGQNSGAVKNSESDSSNAECADSSEDDIEMIKGLDPVKLQAFIEKKIEDRRMQRYNRLVEEKPISPRKEEDRIYNQMEVRKYKENKEKIRKRKEEIRRRRESSSKASIGDFSSTDNAEPDEVNTDAVPIQDYLLSSDEEVTIKAECNNSPLIDKIVQGDKIVDELDALQCKRPLKRPLPIREKYEHKKRKVDKSSKDSSKSSRRNKDGDGGGSSTSSSSSSSKYRKIREKFRCDIAGIIVQHLKPYRKENCFSGRILTEDDFNHLARKLTHFVMVKELKYCESIGQTLVVTESVKNKSREFIKKYMAKYDGVYVRPKNDPEFKEIPFL